MRALFVIILLAALFLPSGHASASPPSDISTADLKTLQTQAAQGDMKAQTNLGWMYLYGQGVPHDYVQARQWWEKAAAQGDAEAQVNIGVMYAYGDGVSQDYTMARGWYEKAAAQGNTNAQTNLGGLYAQGKGVSQDYVQAAKWYEKAAAQGAAGAQHNLGLLYRDGQGVPQDNVRASMWLNLAAASTDPTQKLTADIRDEVASRMTPAQISEAQRLAHQCQTQHFKGC
jgi:TPR repeat protein